MGNNMVSAYLARQFCVAIMEGGNARSSRTVRASRRTPSISLLQDGEVLVVHPRQRAP